MRFKRTCKRCGKIFRPYSVHNKLCRGCIEIAQGITKKGINNPKRFSITYYRKHKKV